MKKLYFSSLFMLFCAVGTFAQQEQISFELFFEFDKAILKEESRLRIDSVLKNTQERRIQTRVSGHTCDIGGDDYNMGLSEKRAISAFDYVKGTGEPEDKVELFFYGERDAKYPNDGDGRPKNRRVEITFTLEDDDVDTLVTDRCASVFIEKATYEPNKNKDIKFEIRFIDTPEKVKSENIEMMDNTGRRLYASGIMYYAASINGQELSPKKNLKIKIPAVPGNYKEGYSLYRGEESGGKIKWVDTGKKCDPTNKDAECKTYDFDWTFSGYCACAKPRECEEDCNENPFGGEERPNLSDKDIRYSGNGMVVRFDDKSYPKPLADLEVKVIDDTQFSEDLTMCQYFDFNTTTKEVFPAHKNIVNPLQNIIIKAKDGGNDITSNDNKTQKIYVPRKLLKEGGLDAPILMPGSRDSKGYIKWNNDKFEPTTCLGSVDCEYVVFEVPGYGNYKLAGWQDAANDDKPNKFILKTRVLKECKVQVGEKTDNVPNVYRAGVAQRNGKDKPKEFFIKEYDAGKIVVLVRFDDGKKKLYQEAKLSDLKKKSIKVDKTEKMDMYIMRRRDFKKIDDFADMELSKCK